MSVKIFHLLICLYFSFSALAQSLNKRELISLQRHIELFLLSRDSVYMEGRPTEFVQLVFEVDSNGKINGIHVMGVDSDTTYRMLKLMTVDYFKDWTSQGCKNRKIIIPFFYASDNPKKSYADKLLTDYYRKIKDLIIESDKIIIVKWLSSIAPLHPPEGYKTGNVRKVKESLKQ